MFRHQGSEVTTYRGESGFTSRPRGLLRVQTLGLPYDVEFILDDEYRMRILLVCEDV